MQLTLLAPGLIGLALAVGTLAYAHSIVSRRRSAPAVSAAKKEPPSPFELSPPILQAETEGAIHSHPVEQIREMVL
jgi:hypothetical protein